MSLISCLFSLKQLRIKCKLAAMLGSIRIQHLVVHVPLIYTISVSSKGAVRPWHDKANCSGRDLCKTGLLYTLPLHTWRDLGQQREDRVQACLQTGALCSTCNSIPLEFSLLTSFCTCMTIACRNALASTDYSTFCELGHKR